MIFKLLRRLLASAPAASEGPRTPLPTPPPLSEALIAPLRRSCWQPIVEHGDSPLHSKFSGTPAVAPGESWPTCAHCGKAMQLFVQLNVAEFPPGFVGPWTSGLLQLFYCTSRRPNCEIDCEAYFPFSKSVLARIVDGSLIAAPETPPAQQFPSKRIIGWSRQDDYPSAQELEGSPLSNDEIDALSQSGYPVAGEKLGGWPAWVQHVEYPSCPECGSPMSLVFQIDSEDNLPYMFGDVGCGHITYCPTHPHRLAFAWACC
jgi:hypothetical protein